MGSVGYGRGKIHVLNGSVCLSFALVSSVYRNKLYRIAMVRMPFDCRKIVVIQKEKENPNKRKENYNKEKKLILASPPAESQSRRGRSEQRRVPFHFRRLVNYAQVAMTLEISLSGKSPAPRIRNATGRTRPARQ